MWCPGSRGSRLPGRADHCVAVDRDRVQEPALPLPRVMQLRSLGQMLAHGAHLPGKEATASARPLSARSRRMVVPVSDGFRGPQARVEERREARPSGSSEGSGWRRRAHPRPRAARPVRLGSTVISVSSARPYALVPTHSLHLGAVAGRPLPVIATVGPAAYAGTLAAPSAASSGMTMSGGTSRIGAHATSSIPLPWPPGGSQHSRPHCRGTDAGLETDAGMIRSFGHHHRSEQDPLAVWHRGRSPIRRSSPVRSTTGRPFRRISMLRRVMSGLSAAAALRR